jgi:hypothetical protein
MSDTTNEPSAIEWLEDDLLEESVAVRAELERKQEALERSQAKLIEAHEALSLAAELIKAAYGENMPCGADGEFWSKYRCAVKGWL